jgi:signal transduction histidine kinase
VRFRPSLYARLILVLLAPMLLAMAAAWAIGVGIVTSTLEQRIEGQLRNAATVVATLGLPYTPELLRRLALLQQSDFVLLDRSGGVAVSTSTAAADAVQASLAGPGHEPWSSAVARKLQAPARSLAVYQTIDASQDPRYSALVAVASLDDARSAAERAAWWLGLAMLAASVALGALLLALVRSITRPLAELAAFAGRISSGERTNRLELRRADEIGALGEALNRMMVRLGSYEEQLASRSRMSALGAISARLAHEIRNPLTGVKLHLQLLAESIAGGQSQRVRQLLGEMQRLELLVSSTLMLGAEQPLDARPTPIARLIAEVIDLMAPSLAHREIEARIRCDEKLQATVDRGRLRQALLNLVVNAADAMPQGGRLLIRAERDNAADRLLIHVDDSGAGVSDDLRARLRSAPASTKPFGLGVGLTVCRDVAREHGGELTIGGSPELGGARFTIALPFTPVAAKADTED